MATIAPDEKRILLMKNFFEPKFKAVLKIIDRPYFYPISFCCSLAWPLMDYF